MESHVTLPPDGSGKKSRTRVRTIGANAVHTQVVAHDAWPTFIAWANDVAFTQNKHFISIFNGSSMIIRLRELLLVPLGLAAITGVPVRFDALRTTGQNSGTGIVPVAMDSADDALPGQVAVATGAAVVEGDRLFGLAMHNDELAINSTQGIQAAFNLLPGFQDTKPLTIRSGEGFTLKNLTNTTVGTFGVRLLFTLED